MAARMARTIAPVTATSASWKVVARAGTTTRTPFLERDNLKAGLRPIGHIQASRKARLPMSNIAKLAECFG